MLFDIWITSTIVRFIFSDMCHVLPRCWTRPQVVVDKDLHDEVVSAVDKEVEVREFEEVANLFLHSSRICDVVRVAHPTLDPFRKLWGALPLQTLLVLIVLGVFIASSFLLFLAGEQAKKPNDSTYLVIDILFPTRWRPALGV